MIHLATQADDNVDKAFVIQLFRRAKDIPRLELGPDL